MTDREKTTNPPAGEGQGTGPVDKIDRGRAWLAGIGIGALAIGALVIAFTIGTNYSDEPAPVAPEGEVGAQPLPGNLSEQGRELFVSSCGSCHALAEADTAGVGSAPDLDTLAPDAALVKQAIAQGGTGSGMMPPGLLTGKDADEVAEYVAAATGGG